MFRPALDEVILDPRFKTASSDLELAIAQSMPGTVIFLVGVTGAGKTWVRRTVARRLFGDPAHWPLGKVPYVEVMSLLADRGYFSSKDQATTLVEQILAPDLRWLFNDPNVDPGPYSELVSESKRNAEFWRKSPRRTEREAWRSCIYSGSSRNIKLIGFEHASLMCKNRIDGTGVQHTLNLISVATDMGTSVVLTTTPAGYELWADYPEVARRARHVWINPYQLSNERDAKNFTVLLKKLCVGIRFSPEDLPLKALEAIADATQTSPGLVRKLMARANIIAQTRGSALVEMRDLRAAFPTKLELVNLKLSAQRLYEIQEPFAHPSLPAFDDFTQKAAHDG